MSKVFSLLLVDCCAAPPPRPPPPSGPDPLHLAFLALDPLKCAAPMRPDAQEDQAMHDMHLERIHAGLLRDKQAPQTLAAAAGSVTTCVDGKAGTYPCSKVDLLSFLPLSNIGGGSGNDCW